MEMATRMRGEPLTHCWMIMRPVIVADQMQLPPAVAAGQRIEEFDELSLAMAPITTAVHFAAGDLQCGEQTGGAVALVVVAHLCRNAGSERQQRCGPAQRLNLGFLVYAQYQRTFGRVEIEPNDVSRRLVKLRIGA
jgi:hypothetical protein